jgi:hypothetical protein
VLLQRRGRVLNFAAGSPTPTAELRFKLIRVLLPVAYASNSLSNCRAVPAFHRRL